MGGILRGLPLGEGVGCNKVQPRGRLSPLKKMREEKLVLADGYTVNGRQIARETIVDSTLIKNVKKHQTVRMYEDLKIARPEIRVDSTDGMTGESAIVISPEKEALINSSREVTITFTVNSSGLVDPNSITITPSAMLPIEIQGEIKDQIATWRFLVPSSYEGYGQVSFNYNIIKR